MKLINHVLKIRSLVQQAIDNRFAKMGIKETGLVPVESLPQDLIPKRKKLEDILNNHLIELQDYSKARQETINECTFTLFNKIAAIKVMEEKELFPEVIKRRPENGNKSFAHNLWLEENPEEKFAERQGLKHFLQAKFNELGENFSLYNENYPYSLMPTADELYDILEAFNEVEEDPDCGNDIWKGDDILGWVYENFNSTEKAILKESGKKTEYDKVSLQSQVYTPQWVVKFLVDNSLGKMYLEMFPDSDLVKPDENGEVQYKIANAPTTRRRDVKKMEEIRVIDPACGSGNFLIYTFDLLYDMYVNQVEQYGADYSRRDIARLIMENNIYGVDLDERAVQLSQIALFIKAKERGGRRVKNPSHTNIVSTHFFLPDYSEVESEFVSSGEWDTKQRETIKKIWSDLQNAYKFGTLVRVEEVLNGLSLKEDEGLLFAEEMSENLFSFKHRVTEVLRDQVKAYCEKNASDYALTKAEDAMTFLRILSMPFDVVVANPPYTDSGSYGPELKTFIEDNYKKTYKFNANLYACFIKRCYELASNSGKIGMISPLPFMYITSFKDVRAFILKNTHIHVFAELGLGGVFEVAQVDAAAYVLEKEKENTDASSFIRLIQYKGFSGKPELFTQAYLDLFSGARNKHVFTIDQKQLMDIDGFPFIYWISSDFRKMFKRDTFDKYASLKVGLQSGDNNRFLRYWWEVNRDSISNKTGDGLRWHVYSKGGPYKKWYGNLWAIVDWDNDGYSIKNFKDESGRLKSRPQNSDFYFKEGITYSSVGSKSVSFRYLPSNSIFDVGGPGIFPGKFSDIFYLLAFLNSPLVVYICDCLNPTVNTNQGDLSRVPFVIPTEILQHKLSNLARQNMMITQSQLQNSLLDSSSFVSPIEPNVDIDNGLHQYFINDLLGTALVLINESIINKEIYKLYQLSSSDVEMLVDNVGESVGNYPVSRTAIESFVSYYKQKNALPPSDDVIAHLNSCVTSEFKPVSIDWGKLYQAGYSLEEISISNKINPVEVWYRFSIQNSNPYQKTKDIVFELITDTIRNIFQKDDDGIIPIINSIGETRLDSRIEEELDAKGFSMGQISRLFNILGKSITPFLEEDFFAQLTNHVNMFRFLPCTPFIWHLTSGSKHAIDLFVSIYKWDRNALFRIKSVYVAERESQLKDQLNSLDRDNSISSLRANEIKDKIFELKEFESKIDALLSSGYEPDINLGVAKNIAPLQKIGIIPYEVLNSAQVKKYLSVNWLD